MTTTPPQPERLTLPEQVANLAAQLGKYKITHRVIRWLVVSVVFDICLSIVCLALGLALQSSNDHLQANQERQDCTSRQRQALTALSNNDQDANRLFYTALFGLQTGDVQGVLAAKDHLYATWDRDKALRAQIVANRMPVTFTVAADGVTFDKAATFTVEPCR